MKNFIIYTLLSSFAIGSFAIIDTLFYLKMGLDWHMIALLSSILNITVLIAELPTGILADRVGVFKSVMIGTLLRAIACFCYVVDFSYHFYVASILAGVGIAFLSGSINASIIKLKQTLKDDAKNISTEKLFANIRYYKSMATLLGGVVGFYLFQIQIAYAWVLAGVFLLISSFFLVPLIKAFNFNNSNTTTLLSFGEISWHYVKTPIFWACVLFSVSAVAPMLSWQVLFHEFDNGLLLGFLLLNTAILLSSIWLKKYTIRPAVEYGVIILNLIALFFMPLLRDNIIMLALLLFFHVFCHSASSTFIFAKFHDQIDDKHRNGLESLSSALDGVLLMPIYAITAYFLNQGNQFLAFMPSVIIGGLVLVLYVVSHQRRVV